MGSTTSKASSRHHQSLSETLGKFPVHCQNEQYWQQMHRVLKGDEKSLAFPLCRLRQESFNAVQQALLTPADQDISEFIARVYVLLFGTELVKNCTELVHAVFKSAQDLCRWELQEFARDTKYAEITDAEVQRFQSYLKLNDNYQDMQKFMDLVRDSLSVRRLAVNACMRMFMHDKSPQLCTQMPSFDSSLKSHLMTSADIWMMQVSLPAECTAKWSLLYSSQRDGHAWNIFSDRVQGVANTFLVLQDKDSYKFGTYAEEKWQKHTSFYGTPRNFLFTLAPEMAVYNATTYNENYQYFQEGTQTLLNGIGFGGQLEYFGLYIEGDLLRGHSKAAPLSSTYQNPQLSRNQDFDIDRVEVWRLKEVEVDDTLIQEGKRKGPKHSEVLDFLEMAGERKAYSKDVKRAQVDSD